VTKGNVARNVFGEVERAYREYLVSKARKASNRTKVVRSHLNRKLAAMEKATNRALRKSSAQITTMEASISSQQRSLSALRSAANTSSADDIFKRNQTFLNSKAANDAARDRANTAKLAKLMGAL
jgi:Mg2+ and Co2+ transporter CorA